ncbi:MAG: glucose-1-phosphate adenylyltransferase subunit GlgD [Eubacteriales bacterium]|nr:glucose-1-phosphate adenylyltransferase subunit GlgD [Eubacteriales bacterium]
MVTSKTINTSAMGIIFPNSYDGLVPELTGIRLMASIPFASRYRLIDFVLSSMVHGGIDNVSVMVQRNYLSLMDHLGSGRAWDLTRKNGGLNIIPPYAEKESKLFNGHVEALASLLKYLKERKEKYVVLSNANYAMNFDFRALLKEHVESGADVTMVYREEEIPEGLHAQSEDMMDLYYTIDMNQHGRVTYVYMNRRDPGVYNHCMNITVIDRELLIELVHVAYVRGDVYFTRDVLAPKVNELNVHGYKFEGYAAEITGLKSYFEENMKLLKSENLDALFDGPSIYTKIRDDNPTVYVTGCKVKNIMAADGGQISGEVENSVLFRGVKIGKGAKVKNCIIMQDTVIEDGAVLEYVIADKDVRVTAGKELKGNEAFPVFVGKGQEI